MNDYERTQYQQLIEKFSDRILILNELIEKTPIKKLNANCFDEKLFQQKELNSGYKPFIEEIEHHNNQLNNLINKIQNNDSTEQFAYLIELITNQIIALQREIATQDLRQKDQLSYTESLYERHAKNLAYLRRLEEMRSELEKLPNSNYKKQKLVNSSQRIARCKQAIIEIEKQMV